MSYFRQNKTTLWILMAIIFFNVAAFATIYYKLNTTKCEGQCKKEDKGCFQSYLKNELNLTPAQAAKFESEKDRYHDTVLEVHKLMMLKKDFINDEMAKTIVDTNILYKATDELGDLYALTRKLYINHYFHLSEICNAEQRKKLSSIIGNVFCCEGRNDGMIPEGKRQKNHQACSMHDPNKF